MLGVLLKRYAIALSRVSRAGSARRQRSLVAANAWLGDCEIS